MGTRNLTMVVSGKQTKVAQYGQWDGYPEGQGWTILKFLRRVNLKRFKERVDALRFMTEADEKPVNDYIKAFQEKNGKKWGNESWGKFGWLSRDICGQILTAIMGNPVRHYDINSGKYKRHEYTVKFVQDNSEFAADSIWCEWAYVIDLDKGTFEVYKGFNKWPLGKEQRFRYLQDLNLHMDKKDDGTLYHNGYYPVRHLVTFKLNNLPTPHEFLKACIGEKDYAEYVKNQRERAKKRRVAKKAEAVK